MICKTRAELPEEYGCRQCGDTKPIKQMVLVHRKRTQDFLLRPRCKKCHKPTRRDTAASTNATICGAGARTTQRSTKAIGVAATGPSLMPPVTSTSKNIMPPF